MRRKHATAIVILGVVGSQFPVELELDDLKLDNLARHISRSLVYLLLQPHSNRFVIDWFGFKHFVFDAVRYFKKVFSSNCLKVKTTRHCRFGSSMYCIYLYDSYIFRLFTIYNNLDK